MTTIDKAEWVNDSHIKQTIKWLHAIQADIQASITRHAMKGIVTDSDKAHLDVARGQYMLINVLVNGLQDALPALEQLPRKS